MKQTDELGIGWVRNENFKNPDLTNRNEQPTDIEWCADCNRPESLCDCDD